MFLPESAITSRLAVTAYASPGRSPAQPGHSPVCGGCRRCARSPVGAHRRARTVVNYASGSEMNDEIIAAIRGRFDAWDLPGPVEHSLDPRDNSREVRGPWLNGRGRSRRRARPGDRQHLSPKSASGSINRASCGSRRWSRREEAVMSPTSSLCRVWRWVSGDGFAKTRST